MLEGREIASYLYLIGAGRQRTAAAWSRCSRRCLLISGLVEHIDEDQDRGSPRGGPQSRRQRRCRARRATTMEPGQLLISVAVGAAPARWPRSRTRARGKAAAPDAEAKGARERVCGGGESRARVRRRRRKAARRGESTGRQGGREEERRQRGTDDLCLLFNFFTPVRGYSASFSPVPLRTQNGVSASTNSSEPLDQIK